MADNIEKQITALGREISKAVELPDSRPDKLTSSEIKANGSLISRDSDIEYGDKVEARSKLLETKPVHFINEFNRLAIAAHQIGLQNANDDSFSYYMMTNFAELWKIGSRLTHVFKKVNSPFNGGNATVSDFSVNSPVEIK